MSVVLSTPEEDIINDDELLKRLACKIGDCKWAGDYTITMAGPWARLSERRAIQQKLFGCSGPEAENEVRGLIHRLWGTRCHPSCTLCAETNRWLRKQHPRRIKWEGFAAGGYTQLAQEAIELWARHGHTKIRAYETDDSGSE